MAKAKKGSTRGAKSPSYHWSGGYSTKNLGGVSKPHKLRKAKKA